MSRRASTTSRSYYQAWRELRSYSCGSSPFYICYDSFISDHTDVGKSDLTSRKIFGKVSDKADNENQEREEDVGNNMIVNSNNANKYVLKYKEIQNLESSTDQRMACERFEVLLDISMDEKRKIIEIQIEEIIEKADKLDLNIIRIEDMIGRLLKADDTEDMEGKHQKIEGIGQTSKISNTESHKSELKEKNKVTSKSKENLMDKIQIRLKFAHNEKENRVQICEENIRKKVYATDFQKNDNMVSDAILQETSQTTPANISNGDSDKIEYESIVTERMKMNMKSRTEAEADLEQEDTTFQETSEVDIKKGDTAIQETSEADVEQVNTTIQYTSEADIEQWDITIHKTSEADVEQGNTTIEEKSEADVHKMDIAVQETSEADVEQLNKIIKETQEADVRKGDSTIQETSESHVEQGDTKIQEKSDPDVEQGNTTIQESLEADVEQGNTTIRKTDFQQWATKVQQISGANVEQGNTTIQETSEANFKNVDTIIQETSEADVEQVDTTIYETSEAYAEQGEKKIQETSEADYEQWNITIQETSESNLKKGDTSIQETSEGDVEHEDKTIQETSQANLKKGNTAIQETSEAYFGRGNKTIQETAEADVEQENTTTQETSEADVKKGNTPMQGRSEVDIEQGDTTKQKTSEADVEKGNTRIQETSEADVKKKNTTIQEESKAEVEQGDRTMQERSELDVEQGNTRIQERSDADLKKGDKKIQETSGADVEQVNTTIQDTSEGDIKKGNTTLQETSEADAKQGDTTMQKTSESDVELGNTRIQEISEADVKKSDTTIQEASKAEIEQNLKSKSQKITKQETANAKIQNMVKNGNNLQEKTRDIEGAIRLTKAMKLAEQGPIYKEETILKATRIAEIRRIEVGEKILETKRKLDIEQKKIENEKKSEVVKKRAYRIKQEQDKLVSFERELAAEAFNVAGDGTAAFFGGSKDIQIKQILSFLKENTPQSQLDLDVYQSSKNIGSRQDQLSTRVTEVFPCLYIASFLTVTEKDISTANVTCVIEVSKEFHAMKAADALQITWDAAAYEETFDKIADVVANTKKKGGRVLICSEESTRLAASLSIAYAVKYENLSVKKAAKVLCKRRPTASLYPVILVKLHNWADKLDRGGSGLLPGGWLKQYCFF